MNNLYILTFDGVYSPCHLTRTDKSNAIQAYIDLFRHGLRPKMCKVNLTTFVTTKLTVGTSNGEYVIMGVL